MKENPKNRKREDEIGNDKMNKRQQRRENQEK